MPSAASMLLTRPLLTLAASTLALVAGTVMRAQAPAVSAAQRCAGVFAHDDQLVAAAKSWRATFGERGVTFRPALGREAPAAHTLTLATRTIARGDVMLLGAHDASTPLRRHDRERVTFAWPGVDERYHARPDGLEQSFVFARRPAGRGDLVVTLDVATDLAPDATGARWLDEHDNGVAIGEVIAIDGKGERCRGERRLAADGALELRLPGAFVDRCVYPLELDPLIGTATQAYNGVDADFPDVAYDGFSDTYCVAWTQFYGGGQTGIVGSVFTADPLGFGYAFGINQNLDADSVRVTSIGGTGVFVMVWVSYDQNGNWIDGIAFEPVQAQSTGLFTIDGPFDVWNPLLSGEATAYDDDCLCAWLDSTYGLLGCTIQVDVNLQVGATPVIQVAGGNVFEPAISKQGGDAGLHLVTWVDRPVGSPGWVRAQVVDHDFNLLGPGAWIQNAPQDAGYPAVDGDGFRFLVAWEEQEVQNPSTTDVRGKIVTVGQGGVTSVGTALDLVAAPGVIDYAADVSLLGDWFGLAFMKATPTGIYSDDCWAQVLSPAGAPIGPAQRLDVNTTNYYRYEHAPRLIGRRCGDPSTQHDDGVVVFADQSTQSPFDSDIGVQGLEALGPGGPVTDLGGGCGPGGLATSNGPFAIGNPAAPLELFGAQPLAIPFVLVGMPDARVSCGVCSFVDALGVWFAPNSAGTVATTLAIPGDPGLVGASIDFQFLSFNVLYVGCPALPGVALSNAVRATIDF
ncbi:MAG: hypothetical protein H6835_16305 [Planctomycetes bacterium]|nr:hypothetical protein [Planctomycetota bacterium]